MAAKLKPEIKQEFIARYSAGEELTDLANLLSIHPDSCRRLLREAGVPIRGRTRVLPSEQEQRDQQIREDYEAGFTVEELMTKYGKSRPIVNCIITDIYQANILERNNKIIRLHEEGFTLRQIAEMVDLCHAQVRNVLDNLDIPRLTCPHLKINESKLTTESPELFYWVGWAATDGSMTIRNNSYRYTLRLQQGDTHIIEKFAKYLAVDRLVISTIQVAPSRIGNQAIAGGIQSSWGFTNNNLQIWANNYGIVPNKTYNYQEAQIPDIYFGDYLRGVIEGDGSIRVQISNNIYSIQIAGNLAYLDWLTSKLRYFGYTSAICTRKRNDIYGVITMQGKNNIEWLYNFCNAKNNPLRLDRKWNKLDKYYN